MPHEHDGRNGKQDTDAASGDESRFTKEELGTAGAMSAMATLAEMAVDHGRNSANSSRAEDSFAPRGLPGATGASQKDSSAVAAFRNSLISNSNSTNNHASPTAPAPAAKAGRGKAGAAKSQSARSIKARARKQQPKKEEVEREEEEEEEDELQGDDSEDDEMDVDKTAVELSNSSGANSSLVQNGRGKSADAVTQPDGGAAKAGMGGSAANPTASSASPTARDENAATGMHSSASPTLAAASSSANTVNGAASSSAAASQRPKVAKMVLQPIPPFRGVGGAARGAPPGPAYPTQFHGLRAGPMGPEGPGDAAQSRGGNAPMRLASGVVRKRISGNGYPGAGAGPPGKRIVTDGRHTPPPTSQPPMLNQFSGNVPPPAPGTGDLSPEESEYARVFGTCVGLAR